MKVTAKTSQRETRVQSNYNGLHFLITFFIVILLGNIQTGYAQTAYNPGKLAVLVVGDGTAALTGSATPVFVKEFNISGAAQAGTLRTSLPTTATTGTGSVDRALTQSGSSTSEGFLGLSRNRQCLVVTGYNSTIGMAGVSSSVATTFPTNTRVVAKIDATAVADTKTTLHTSYSGVAIRSAATQNATEFWTAGAGGVGYVPDGNIAAATSLAATNTRVVSIFNSQLYTSSGATGFRLASIGTGLPTSGTPTLTNLSGFLTTTGDPYSHVFIDLNGGGPEVMYVASLSTAPNGLLKYTSADNGVTWTSRGSLTGSVFGVTGVFNTCTGNIDLYITSNTSNAKPNALYKFSDLNVTAGSPANITSNGSALSAVGTLLATAAANTAFGGVAFTPGSRFDAPSIYNVTGGNGCTNVGIVMGLNDSETGISYQLFNGAATVGSPLIGTGAAISFGSQSAVGVYTIVAANLLTGCTTTMVGSSVINALPIISFSGLASQYCITLTEVTLTGSPAGGLFSGPGISGNIFEPASVGAGGPYTITYDYTDIVTGCSNSVSQTVTVNATPTVSIGATVNTVCAESTANITLNFTGSGPWIYSINNSTPVSTPNNPETIPVNPAGNTNYIVTSFSDANCSSFEWVNFAADYGSSHGIKADATLWGWGINTNSQLGNGTNTSTNIPVQIGSSSNWVKTSSGDLFSVAIKNNGTLWAWGLNIQGQLGDGTTTNRNAPVQIGSSSDWKSVFCAPAHSLAIKNDGTLWAWGFNNNGQLGDATITDKHSPVQIGISTDWVDVAGGAYFSLGIKANGTIWGWGLNTSGQLGDGTNSIIPVQRGTSTDWAKISASISHSLAIKTNGKLWAWGSNTNGQLGDGTNIQRNSPVHIGSATNWTKIFAGNYYSMGIRQDGTLWAWGLNDNGQLGDGSNIDRNSPVQIGLSTNWSKIILGSRHSLAIKTDGTLWGWGDNLNGQLGDGTNADKNIPTQLISAAPSVKIYVTPLPTVSFSGLAAQYCITSSTVTLTGSPAGGTFSGPGVSDTTFSPATAGVGGPYTITYLYTDMSTGCSNSNSQVVSIGNLPTASISGNNFVCFGGTVLLTATATPGSGTIISYQWVRTTLAGSTNLGTVATQSINSGADYTVIITNSFGCSDTSAVFNVTAFTEPTVSFSGLVVQYCSNAPAVTLTGNQAPEGIFSGPGITDNGNGTAIFNPATAGAGGSYTITYSYTIPGTTCSNSISQTVMVSLAPVTPVISGTLCAGSTLTVSPTNGIASLVWNLNGSPVSTAFPTGVANGITVAGGNGAGPGANELSSPYGVSVDGAGNVYVADVENHRIQRWSPGAFSGVTVAGGNGDGSGPDQFSYPFDLYVDGTGNIFVADIYNFRIQKWAPGATSGTTVAGGNGQGSAANQIGSPYGVAVDGLGNIYISDPENYRVQKWSPGATSGTTVAGGNGNGSAANQFAQPDKLCIDATGNIYVADALNNRIQRWAPGATSGVTVAGGNGVGTASNQLNYPNAVRVDVAGNIYVTDNGNNRIQKWAPGATSGITVAGGNGQGSGANQLDVPYGISLDSAGNIYIADAANHRIQQWAQTINDSLPNAADGTYAVTVTGFNGCSASSAPVVVNPLPLVSFSGLSATYCVNAASVTLTGNPAGGAFSGSGVAGDIFDPAVAGPGGPYTITYTYTHPITGCSNTSTQQVNVTICTANITVNLKLFLQGYYIDGGILQPVLNNQSVPNSLATETDSITVELHDAATFALVDSKVAVLLTNGTVSATFTQPAGFYYFGIKHRNSIQTWSADSVMCVASTPLYNFTTAANKAMGDNQVEVQTGKWAFYTGDLNQDDFIDGNDFPAFDSDSFNGVNSVYVATDMNGDGFVDGNDFPVFDVNSFNGVSAVHP